MTGHRRVATAILAAGSSTRFGGDKLLHRFRGKPLALHIVDTLADTAPGVCFAIVPPGNPGRRDVFHGTGVAVFENPHAAQGMGTSIATAAMHAMMLQADAMLVCLADMPLVTREHLEALLAVDAPVVATEAAGVRSPPIVFARSVFEDLRKLTGDHGPRHLLKRATIVQADPAMVRDFDTPGDFL